MSREVPIAEHFSRSGMASLVQALSLTTAPTKCARLKYLACGQEEVGARLAHLLAPIPAVAGCRQNCRDAAALQ